jgi:hypothetical protein
MVFGIFAQGAVSGAGLDFAAIGGPFGPLIFYVCWIFCQPGPEFDGQLEGFFFGDFHGVLVPLRESRCPIPIWGETKASQHQQSTNLGQIKTMAFMVAIVPSWRWDVKELFGKFIGLVLTSFVLVI